MSTLSKSVQAALLENAVEQAKAAATPYEAIAKEIAVAVEAQKVHTDKAKGERTSLWNGFKRALSIAASVGHSPTTLRIGLEVACEQNGVPGGSFRSYVNTVVSLFTDINEGNISLADAEKLTITDARKRYRTVSPVQEARQNLMAAIADWTPEEIGVLTSIALGEADDDEIAEVQETAVKHAEEAAAQAQAEQGEEVRQAA